MALGGQIDFSVVPLTAAATSGLAMPGLFAEKRNPSIPDVPTIKEQGFNVAPQYSHAERVKRRDDGLGHGQAADDFVHPLDHFRGRLVGECDRQDRLRHRAKVFDQMCDAIGDNPGLSATSAGQNEQRPFASFDSLTLLRIELVEEGQTSKAPYGLQQL